MRSSLLVILLAFSATAGAQGFDYNYFSLGYGNIDFDEVNVDGDGFGLEGSYGLSDNYHIFFDYNSAGLDFDIDATTWGVGFGYNKPISEKVDFVGRVSYEYIELDAPGVSSADDNGLGLGIGMRFAASNELELNAGINYVDYSDSGDDTGFEAGGLYKFTDSFALGLSGEWSDDVSSYTLRGRFYFGK
ncbi:MAG: porin family protein [Gammaproteobacteria bacterium]|nr:porin family protein [Gammaproteobacteria bacterium]